MRLMITQPGSGAGPRGDGPDLHLGVGEQQPEDLSARIPGRSGHCHSYTCMSMPWSRKFMQTLSSRGAARRRPDRSRDSRRY